MLYFSGIHMREVFAVRLFTLFAASCLVFGSVMYYNYDDNLIENSEESDRLSEPAGADFASDGPSEEEVTTNPTSNKQSQDTYSGLIFLGAGGLSSLIFGALFSEVFRITVLISLLTPMISRSKNREDLLTRGRLLGYIEANAGIYFSALRDSLGLANGVSAYHLQVLEKNGKIISWKDGKLRRYAISQISKSKLENIRNPIMGTRLAILEVLSNSGKLGLSNSEIGKKLSMSRQLMNYHISELRGSDYIDSNLKTKRPKWMLTDLGIEALNLSYSFQNHQ
jgi:DNA-binding transcriptional ArsR family regulator